MHEVVSRNFRPWMRGPPKNHFHQNPFNHFAVWNLPIQGWSSGNFPYMLPDLMLLQGPATTSLFNIALIGKIGEKCIFLCVISHYLNFWLQSWTIDPNVMMMMTFVKCKLKFLNHGTCPKFRMERFPTRKLIRIWAYCALWNTSIWPSHGAYWLC